MMRPEEAGIIAHGWMIARENKRGTFAPVEGTRLQDSPGGENLSARRMTSSMVARAEMAAHNAIAHTTPNRQLRRMVCINPVPPSGQNSRRTFRNR